MNAKRRRREPLPETLPDRRVRGLALLALPLLVIILYGGSLAAPFVYDDVVHIVDSPVVRLFHSALDGFAIRIALKEPRPLLLITYGINYSEWGMNPSAFRLVNDIVHAANACLVFLIAFELGTLAELRKPRPFWLGFVAAALFVSHPLFTESVTYISGRSSSLCATFYFAGLLCTLHAGRVTQASRRWMLLVITIICAGVGWLIKQEAITLPAAGIALIWLAWPQTIRSKTRWVSTAILAAAVLALLAVQLKPIEQVSVATRSNEPLVSAGFQTTVPFKEYALTSIREYSFYYLWRFILPVRLSLDPDPAIVHTPFDIGFLLSMLLLLSLAAVVLWLRRRRPVSAAGIALILISPLSAYCLFPLADIVAEHRAYISGLGVAIVIADGLRSRAGIAVSCGLVILFGWLTLDRNKVWNDEVTLWEDASRQAPAKVRPHVNLGALYQARGKVREATSEYETVLRLVPDHAASLSNLSSLYLAANDVVKAEDVLNRAVAQHSSFPAIYTNLAVVRMRQQRLDEAKQLLHHVLSLDPQQLLTHHNLGDILLNQGKFSEAVDEYLMELVRNPDFVLTHLHLGLAYQAVGNLEMAKEQFAIVLRLQPGNGEARSALDKMK
jgi:Tfp pilus assembly protein PilF